MRAQAPIDEPRNGADSSPPGGDGTEPAWPPPGIRRLGSSEVFPEDSASAAMDLLGLRMLWPSAQCRSQLRLGQALDLQ